MSRPAQHKWLRYGVGLVALLAAIAWTAVSLLNPISTLSILADDVRESFGLAADRSPILVFARMQALAQRGRIDKAIEIGHQSMVKHPGDEWVPPQLATLYLTKARSDTTHAKLYVGEALKYRDMALSSSNSPQSLLQLAYISDYAGDLLGDQRCIQYRNALRLTDAAFGQIAQRRDVINRHIKTTPEDIEELSKLDVYAEVAHQRRTQVQQKLMDYDCAAGT